MFFNPQVLLPVLGQFRVHLVIAALTLFIAMIKGRTPGKAIQSWLFVIISLCILLSIYFSPIPVDWAHERPLEYFIQFFKCVLSYFMVVLVVQSADDIKKISNVVLVMSFTVGLISILTFKAGFVPLTGPGTAYMEGRLTSFFGGLGRDTNEFASFMLLMFPIPVYMVMKKKGSLIKQISLFSATMVYALCVLLTGSRGTLLAMIVVLFILVIDFRKSVFILIFVLMITALGTYQLSDEIMERIFVLKSPKTMMQDPTAKSRIREMEYSLEIIKSYPLTGVGIGNYRSAKMYFLGVAPDTTAAEIVSHNAFLQVGTEIGLPGMILLILIVIYTYRDFIYSERLLVSREGSNSLYILGKGLRIGFIGFVMALMFLPHYTNALFYFWIALAVTIKNIVQKEIENN